MSEQFISMVNSGAIIYCNSFIGLIAIDHQSIEGLKNSVEYVAAFE